MRSVRVLLASGLLAASAAPAADLSQAISLTQAPPAVQKTIAGQTGGGKLLGIYQSVEDGETIFDVGFMTPAGERHAFCAGADGALESTQVSFAAAPAPVRKTIQIEAAGWQLNGIDRNIEDGGTTYDVEVSKNGSFQTFSVDDDGTLLSVGVALENTPPAVQASIKAQANGGQIESIDKNLDDEQVTYDVRTSKGGVEKNFTLAEDGSMTSAEIKLGDAPGPVQAEIAREVPGSSTVKSIEADFDPEGNTYDIDAVGKDGTLCSFWVGIGGRLLSWQVTPAQVPPAVLATIRNQIGPGKIIRIDKALNDPVGNVLPYEVESRKNGKPFNFNVGPDGAFLGMDVDQ
jgi:hypothetical protein